MRNIILLFSLIIHSTMINGQTTKDTLVVILPKDYKLPTEVTLKLSTDYWDESYDSLYSIPYFIFYENTFKHGVNTSELFGLVYNEKVTPPVKLIEMKTLNNLKVRSLKDTYWLIHDRHAKDSWIRHNMIFFIIKEEDFFNTQLDSINLIPCGYCMYTRSR